MHLLTFCVTVWKFRNSLPISKSLRCGSAQVATTTQMQGRFWGFEKCSKTLPRTKGLHSAGRPCLDVGVMHNRTIPHDCCCFLLFPARCSAPAASSKSAQEVVNFPRLVFHRFVANLRIKKIHWKRGLNCVKTGAKIGSGFRTLFWGPLVLAHFPQAPKTGSHFWARVLGGGVPPRPSLWSSLLEP